MKKAQVIYDSQTFDLQKFGGISRYFCEIISRLDIKYDISLRYTENHYLLQSKLARHLIRLPHFIFKHLEWKLHRKNRKFIRKRLQTSSFYLFHPTYYDPYFLKFIDDNPFVITVHDMIHELFPEFFNNSEEMIRQKAEIIKKANWIIAISENTKKDIINILSISPEKISVIYHGTSMKAPDRKAKLSLPDRYILFIGDRAIYKNFQRLLEAFASITQIDKNLNLICTGSAFSEDERQQISSLNIENQILQIPINDKYLNELYNRALLFIYPSLYEGFGIPILEAFACNCPVALSNTSCFPEIAGDAGAYFDPYSVASIASKISEYVYDENKRQALIIAGKERLRLYSWEKSAEETERIYKNVLRII